MAENITLNPHTTYVKEESEEWVEAGPEYCAVLIVKARTGELVDIRVESPARVKDPEALAKAVAFASSVAHAVASEVSDLPVTEVDVVTGDSLVTIVPDGEYLRVGVSTAPQPA